MSRSNGFNPNSLHALERSLFGHALTQHPAEPFSVEAEETDADEAVQAETQIMERQTVEAQAFDWDEAIELVYDSDADSYDAELNGSDSEAFSQDSDWDEEEMSADEVQAFAFEEEERVPLEDPLSHSNSLFALEQSVFRAETSHQFAVVDDEDGDPEDPAIESQAFDWDEAIELECNESFVPASETTSESTAESFDWLPTEEHAYGYGLEYEPPTYEVEAFEVVEEPESDATEDDSSNNAYGFVADQNQSGSDENEQTVNESYTDQSNEQASALETPDVWSDEPHHELSRFNPNTTDTLDRDLKNSQAYGVEHDQTEASEQESSDAVPVQAIVANPPSPPRKSAQPAVALDFDFDEFDRAPASGQTDQASDAAAFAADLEAILRGEKVYEPPAESSPPPAPPPPPSVPSPAQGRSQAPPSQAQSLPKKQPSGHDIFDQMSMAHATAFDLGTFSLEQTFDEFDEILAEEDSVALTHQEEETPQANGAPPQDPQNSHVETVAQSLEWDDDDIAADVKALSAGDWSDNEVEPQQPQELPTQDAASQHTYPNTREEQPLVSEMSAGFDWTITSHSNAMDKKVGYERMLENMRNFVRHGGAKAKTETITLKHEVGASPPTTTLTFIDNNFTVTHINGQTISYNYPTKLPQFEPANLPSAYPASPTAVSLSQKTELLYLFPEAARSVVLQEAMLEAFRTGNAVELAKYSPLVNNYKKTCKKAGVNSDHPERPLTRADYCAYARDLAPGTPDRNKIDELCNCNLSLEQSTASSYEQETDALRRVTQPDDNATALQYETPDADNAVEQQNNAGDDSQFSIMSQQDLTQSFMMAPDSFLNKYPVRVGGFVNTTRFQAFAFTPQLGDEAVRMTPTPGIHLAISLDPGHIKGAPISLSLVKSDVATDIRFLPWEINKVTYCELDAAASWFFTGPMQGCHIYVGHDSVTGTHYVFHVNANDSDADIDRNMLAKDNKVMRLMDEELPNVRLTHRLSRQEYRSDKPFEAFVYGRKLRGEWKFYIHCVEFDSKGNPKIKLAAQELLKTA
jgi:hypothetical protein